MSRYSAPGRWPVRVLLGDAEVHVEESILAAVECLGAPAVEQRPQPVDVDEPLVVREPVERQGRVGGPGREPRLEDPDAAMAELGQAAADRVGVGEPVAVDDDRAVGRHALVDELPRSTLGRVDALEPGDRERHRAREVAATRLALQAPAVVRRARADVDDGEVRVARGGQEVGRRDRVRRWTRPDRWWWSSVIPSCGWGSAQRSARQ